MANEPFIFTVCPRFFLSTSPHLSGVCSYSQEGGRRKRRTMIVNARTRILRVGRCFVRAHASRYIRGQVRKRGHSRISRRSPSPFYINRDNRASVTGQWPRLRPGISFVGSLASVHVNRLRVIPARDIDLETHAPHGGVHVSSVFSISTYATSANSARPVRIYRVNFALLRARAANP